MTDDKEELGADQVPADAMRSSEDTNYYYFKLQTMAHRCYGP